MKTNTKDDNAYKTIGEAAKELNLVNEKTGSLQTHTIRYWETQFKQLKPTLGSGKRRYYSSNNIKMLNYIKFLLKDKGLTINGAKKLLNDTKGNSIDDSTISGVYKSEIKTNKVIKDKVKNIAKIIKELKKLKNG